LRLAHTVKRECACLINATARTVRCAPPIVELADFKT
jgi:hypothetical protein